MSLQMCIIHPSVLQIKNIWLKIKIILSHSELTLFRVISDLDCDLIVQQSASLEDISWIIWIHSDERVMWELWDLTFQ